MFYGYAEQLERLRAKVEEKDTTQVHFLDLQKDGTFIDADTKVVYKNWEQVKKSLSGVVIVDDVPDDEDIDKEVRDDCELVTSE